MKLPKTISICGKVNKVILRPEHNGGSFDEGKAVIEIGTAHKADIPEVVLHEVIESVLAVRNLRYSLERVEPDNGDYLFSFNHDEFEQAIKDIAAALKGIKF